MGTLIIRIVEHLRLRGGAGEGVGFGVGLVIAEQIAAKLVPDVVKNTALKVVHRLPAADDRDLVGAAMNLDRGQSRPVVSLAPGVAAVFAPARHRS
jgi:DNA helicase HerA-like ATPase